MQRRKAVYPASGNEIREIKQKMLNWSQQFSIFLFLDNNNYPSCYPGYECLLATGSHGGQYIADSLSSLQEIYDGRHDWLFGHINYDYKNELEPKLVSSHLAKTGFNEFCFFIPETVCWIDRDGTALTIESFDEPDVIYEAICNTKSPPAGIIPRLTFRSAFSKEEYTGVISQLRAHIADGDCYEINFCNEASVADALVPPLEVFNKLNAVSPAPFAAFYRLGDQYMMCASPERYLRKDGGKIISQPIKGTARRDADPQKDEEIKTALKNDLKERAENVMIVDLVRNDLARCCETGSVAVDELFGAYTFPQVHQLISTVSGTLRGNATFTDAIKYSFPMGSMTGAPKHKVMQLIDKYERSRRELFSGTVGYITPDGDFDFNVVIRSLFYNAATKYLSYQTGGAITYDSNPEKEWEEMRLKAQAIEQIFS